MDSEGSGAVKLKRHCLFFSEADKRRFADRKEGVRAGAPMPMSGWLKAGCPGLGSNGVVGGVMRSTRADEMPHGPGVDASQLVGSQATQPGV